MTDVVDVLVAAGAKIRSLEMAAAAGDITAWPLHRFTFAEPHPGAGVRRCAASVQRLLAHGADPNLRDPRHNTTPLEESRQGNSPGHREVEAILRPLTRGGTPEDQA